MPVMKTEHFLARIDAGFRIHIPVLVRWRNRLEPGEILSVTVDHALRFYSFYARYRKDHRITVPKLVVQHLGLEPGMVVEVTLHSEGEEEAEGSD